MTETEPLTLNDVVSARSFFEEFVRHGRPFYWDHFESDSWRVVSVGAPRQGEYADTLLQQLWEAYWAGYAETKAPRDFSIEKMTLRVTEMYTPPRCRDNSDQSSGPHEWPHPGDDPQFCLHQLLRLVIGEDYNSRYRGNERAAEAAAELIRGWKRRPLSTSELTQIRRLKANARKSKDASTKSRG